MERAAPASAGRVTAVVGYCLTAGAGLLLLAAVLLPHHPGLLTPIGFLRLPAEALVAVGLILVLPGRADRARRIVAAVLGAVIGVLVILKVTDIGFYSALGRSFNPVVDGSLLVAGRGFLAESIGTTGAAVATVAIVAVAAGLPVLTALAAIRLAPRLVRHREPVAGTVTGLAAVWVVCLLLGVQLVPGAPVAAHETDRVVQVAASVQDRREFASELTEDAYRDTPAAQLLTDLRGKDVIIAFVESYGRDAVTDPDFAGSVGSVLESGEDRLRAAGLHSRSGFLEAATLGGASWLNHATLLSGLWVDNQRRYHTLVETDRFTLNRAFQRAGWRTVAVMPAIWEDWPESEFFGYDEVYDADRLDYQGPRMNWGIVPDQFTMSVFERSERARQDRAPVMAEVALVSSHAPWVPVGPMVDWETIDRSGDIFETVAPTDYSVDEVWRDTGRIRAAYGEAVGYSLETLISYAETYGDEDFVLVFLGDHQPAPVVVGADSSWDVPITIVAGDPAILDRVSPWGWHDGLTPGPDAPVWPMDTFRDRFLEAFGSTPSPAPGT